MTDEFVIPVPPVLTGVPPIEVAIVLGSGLSGLADRVEDALVIPYTKIEGFPTSTHALAGHAGRLVVGSLGGKRVACFQGRVHGYQGFSALQTAYPARLAAALGARVLIATNAAGGVNPDLRPGDIMLISDHLNLTGANPLVGWSGPAGGVPFVGLRDAYDPQLRALALSASVASGVDVVSEGVYAALLGPSYETPAEVAMLRMLGADVVGMSTVPEVIAARALGLRVLALSLVTNIAADTGLSHDEVLKVGAAAATSLQALAVEIMTQLP